MAKINKHIEIVASTDKRLSSMGIQSRRAAQAVLEGHYARVGITIVNNLEDLEALVGLKPDVVFLGMKFIPANPESDGPKKIWISEYLDDHDVACTGSDYMAHELELNKELAKQRVLDAGLKTPQFCVVKGDDLSALETAGLTYPVFIKPTDRGGGLGIDNVSVAHDLGQARLKVQSLADVFQCDSLVEEFLPGREFSVAILRDRCEGSYSQMPLELIAPPDKFGQRFLSGAVKSADSEGNAEVTDMTLRSRISTLAMEAFEALGARDYGRIDIRLDNQGVPHFLEANLLPSLLDGYGNFPKACLMNMNLKYEHMLLEIVGLALDRNLKPDKDMVEYDPIQGNVLLGSLNASSLAGL